MADSILDSVKKLLGFSPEDESFDTDIITHINSVFFTLQQLGVGPKDSMMIIDSSATWDSFIGEEKNINAVMSYMHLKVRLLFDPPPTSFAIASMEKNVLEYEWRLNAQVDPVRAEVI